jgi:pyruvoyl-dependent arginine decarboxylase (PvlArgDC)
MNKLRIPHQFFETKGIGQSNDSQYPTSYHLALMDAGIETMNIMTYSSIIPKNAQLIKMPNRDWFVEENFGGVLESIMAVHHGTKSQLISAGLMYNDLFKENGEKVGSIVVERHGNFSKDAVEERLYQSIYELKNKSFSHYNWNENNFRSLISSFEVDEQFGTALVALCFINYE